MVKLKSRECLRDRLRRELANCVKCGACMAFCPVYRLERSETANMRGRLAMLQSIESGRSIPADAVAAVLDSCVGCLTCRTTCPNKVETGVAAIIGRALHAGGGAEMIARRWISRFARRYPVGRAVLARLEPTVESRFPRGAVLRILKTVLRERRSISHSCDVRRPGDSERFETLIFPGCRLSSNGDMIRIAMRVAGQAGFGTVRAADAGCCGVSALADGDLEGYAESVRRLFESIAPMSPKRILLLCPECWYAWRLIPELCDLTEPAKSIWNKGVEFHEAVSKSPWGPARRLDGRFALHEACLYARGGGDKAAPGKLLERIATEKPVNASRDGACCGARGGLVSRSPELAGRIASDRIEELRKLGPDTVVTHCGRCRETLDAGLHAHGINTITFLELLGEASE